MHFENCHQILEYASHNLIDPLENSAAVEGVKVVEDQVPRIFDTPGLDPISLITEINSKENTAITLAIEISKAQIIQTPYLSAPDPDSIEAASLISAV